MAAEIIGGAFLGSAFQFLFDRLDLPEVVNYLRGNNLSEDVIYKLKIVLLGVNAVLDDAEGKQITNTHVKIWLDELQDASYVAEDLLDEIATHALQSNFEAAGSRKSKKRKLTDFIFSSSRSYYQDMNNKLEKILRKLEVLEKRRIVLALTDKSVGEIRTARQPTTSLVEKSEIYGRKGDEDAIIELLLTDDHEGINKVCVIPIVGMGGLGKTTLAQLVYNHHAVGKHFNLKSWVCVAEEFDISKVTKTVLYAVTNSHSHSYDNKDLDSLQTLLKKELTGKKFFIVLDDVWNEDQENWDNLIKPFKHGAQGSKILVTTRNENAVPIMHTVRPHYLGILSDEDCWELFAKHAFGNKDFNAYQDLVKMHREVVVKKCNGLPLAAKTLGGLLRSRVDDAAEWERILKSEIWDLPYNKTKILPVFMLSYLYLPLPVKRCFAFCSVFPKDYKFQRQQLVSLWMAENLLPQATRNKGVEDVGDEYFNELVSMSFFQRSSQGEGYVDEILCERSSSRQESYFVMHDLFHDLAIFVSRGYFFTLENGNSNEDVKKVRHLAVAPDVSLERFHSISKAVHLRTLLPSDEYSFWNLSDEVVNSVILKLRCLRILSLSGCEKVEQLSESIGTLKHLRFLDLSETSIKRLPNSMSMLYNLQTLNLSGCHELIELPKDMHHLINLRHLDISGCDKLKEMPRQISDLKSLQRLSTFIVGEDNGTKIEELRELSDLRGELSLQNLQNLASTTDASEARLMDKKHLEGLHLFWDDREVEDMLHDKEVAEKLLPHTNLKRLSIHGFGGTSFPNWLGDHSFWNIVSIKLESCKYCNSLPPLGQLPSLKTLHIEGLRGVVTVDAEFYGIIGGASIRKPFASLEFLSFSDMSAWEEWSSIGVEDGEVFPMLQRLLISNCPRLGTVDWPDILPSLTKLQIEGNEVLVSSFPRTPALRELKLDVCEKLQLEELPQTVKSIDIAGNNGVESLMEAIRKRQTPFLKELHIHSCCSEITLPAGCLPTTLTVLHINDCERLKFPMMHQHPSIQSVRMTNSCRSLEFFRLDLFPNLSILYISECKKLVSIGVSSDRDHNLTSLSRIAIFGCPNLKSFLEGGLHAPNLIEILVEGSKKLKKLPEQMHNHLPSLKDLQISNIPELESFPEGGLPSNLAVLCVSDCPKLIAQRMKWKLHTLQALTYFKIDGGGVKSFPEEGLLPSTLSFLCIEGFPHLKRLNMKGLQQLTSLEHLQILKCPRLQKLPRQGLPTSLESLDIVGCPVLKERCQRETGQDWNIISRIPEVLIDDKRI